MVLYSANMCERSAKIPFYAKMGGAVPLHPAPASTSLPRWLHWPIFVDGLLRWHPYKEGGNSGYFAFPLNIKAIFVWVDTLQILRVTSFMHKGYSFLRSKAKRRYS